MDEHKDGKGSSRSEKSSIDMDNYIASASDFYSSSDTLNDVKNSTKEKKKVKEGRERKKIGRKTSSVTSLQGKRTTTKKKIMKSKMGQKSISYEGRKTSSADHKTAKEDKNPMHYRKLVEK
eukprot:5266160-Ditylum_brightwellii.AAC.1